MARKNKLGTSFCGLNLDPIHEEPKLKSYLKKKGWSAKQYMRKLIREDLKLIAKLNIK